MPNLSVEFLRAIDNLTMAIQCARPGRELDGTAPLVLRLGELARAIGLPHAPLVYESRYDTYGRKHEFILKVTDPWGRESAFVRGARDAADPRPAESMLEIGRICEGPDVYPIVRDTVLLALRAWRYCAAQRAGEAQPAGAESHIPNCTLSARRRGRPPDTNPRLDRLIFEAWKASACKSFREFAGTEAGRRFGYDAGDLQAACERHRKREARCRTNAVK